MPRLTSLSSGFLVKSPRRIYNLLPNTFSVSEGEPVTFTVTTTNVKDGTTLYWTVNKEEDFATNSGNFTINNNTGTFTVTPTNDDIPEGEESFIASIRTSSITGSVVATSSSVTINSHLPLITYSSRLEPNNQSTFADTFGRVVDISGNIIVVGDGFDDQFSPDSGAAYAFIRVNGTWDGTWVKTQRLVSSDIEASDQFGLSVAVSGNTIVVGAPGEDTRVNISGGQSLGNSNGAAYVFVTNNGGITWTQQAKLLATPNSDVDTFGYSVDIDGDTIIVGVPLGDGAVNSGEITIFDRTGTTWTQTQTFSLGTSNFRLGDVVKISGNIAVATAGNLSRVISYSRINGTWGQRQTLTNSSANQFGANLALDYKTLVVSAAYEDIGGLVDAGAVYVYNTTDEGVTWTLQQKLTGSISNQRFGNAVALDGDTLIISDWAPAPNNTRQSTVYLYTRTEGVWTLQTSWQETDSWHGDDWGMSLAISGDSIVVGDDSGGPIPNSLSPGGTAYVYNYNT
jgi:hypothetical protein